SPSPWPQNTSKQPASRPARWPTRCGPTRNDFFPHSARRRADFQGLVEVQPDHRKAPRFEEDRKRRVSGAEACPAADVPGSEAALIRATLQSIRGNPQLSSLPGVCERLHRKGSARLQTRHVPDRSHRKPLLLKRVTMRLLTAVFGLVVLLPAERQAPAGTVPTDAGPSSTCVGDCDGNAVVTIDEVIVGVGVALGMRSREACPSLDGSEVTVDVSWLVAAVANALNGCRGGESSCSGASPCDLS